MVLIEECDDLGSVLVPQNSQEISKLWDDCMKSRKGHLGRAEFEQNIIEVYDDIYSSLNETNSESISSGSVEFFMEIDMSFVDSEVLSYNHFQTDASDIAKLRFNMNFSSTRNEEMCCWNPVRMVRGCVSFYLGA